MVLRAQDVLLAVGKDDVEVLLLWLSGMGPGLTSCPKIRAFGVKPEIVTSTRFYNKTSTQWVTKYSMCVSRIRMSEI